MKIKSLINFMGGGKIKDKIKTLYFNFKFFPLKEAIHLPVYVAWNVEIRNMKRGRIVFADKPLHPFMLSFGRIDKEYTFDRKSMINIYGKVIVRGIGFHAFAPGCILYVGTDATFDLGNDFSVSHDAKFYIKKFCKIGDNNMWSYFNIIMDNDGHQMLNDKAEIINENKPIRTGDNVWIGSRCTILKGTDIADNIIIGSSSVIGKKLEKENCVYAGQPVRLVKENVYWNRTLM